MDNADGSPRLKGEIRDPYDPQRLAESNLILQSFLPSVTLTAGPLGDVRDHAALLYEVPARPATEAQPARPARTVRQAVFPNASGASISGAAGRIHFGGTAEEGIATLIRFVRGRTRRPLAWWRDRFPADTYLTVLSTTYGDDPAKMACVLCGRPTDSHDWWGPDRWKQGPCCSFGACRPDGRADRGEGFAGTLDELLGGLGGMDDRVIYRGTEIHE